MNDDVTKSSTRRSAGPQEAPPEHQRLDLFEPVQLGPCLLANRIVMAPLTRSRATENGTPTPLMAEYYAQRASAGLIITEGVNVSPQGRGYAFTPGIYEAAQTEAWRRVIEAVHGKGGRIFAQLWHVGRISHPSLQPNGALPVAPSAIRPQAMAFTATGFHSCVIPRALETQEIPEILEQYRRAAQSALAAGFDGVEIHAANGYLIEQGPRTLPGGFAFDPQTLRSAYTGSYIANNGYDLKLALEARQHSRADLIAFGRLYIANPDLVERFRSGAPLNVPDRSTFFGGGAHGYTDYPFMTT